MSKDKLVISAHFKLVFLSVLGLTVFCFLVCLAIGFINGDADTMDDIPEIQEEIFTFARFGWQSGFGAIIGLIGGKALE